MEITIQELVTDNDLPKTKGSFIIENTNHGFMPKIPLVNKQSSIESLDQIREVHTIMSESYEGMSANTHDFLLRESLIDEDFNLKFQK